MSERPEGAKRSARGEGSRSGGKGRRAEAAAEARLKGEVPHGGFLVPRPRLMEQLEINARNVGITFLCAPRSFGKTAVLLERVMQVREGEGRGVARLLDARALSPEELASALRACAEELDASRRPLVAVDNMPKLAARDVRAVATLLRSLRDGGFEVVVACSPAARGLVEKVGDSAKINAQGLKVQMREYALWAQELAIGPSLDIYGLTQGIPALVAALHSITVRPEDHAALSAEIQLLHREAFKDVRAPLRRAMMAMVLLGEGHTADLESAGAGLKKADVTALARDYPFFGIDGSHRSFKCLSMQDDVRERLQREVADREPGLAVACARVLAEASRIDDAVSLADRLLTRADSARLIAQNPVSFCLAGQVRFVTDVIADVVPLAKGFENASVGLVLAAYLAALLTSDYRMARVASSELAMRAAEVPTAVDAPAWDCACACREVWGAVPSTELPQVFAALEEGEELPAARVLRLHLVARDAMLALDAEGLLPALREARAPSPNELDLAQAVLSMDAYLALTLAGEAYDTAEDAWLDELAALLDRRGMPGTASLARMVCELRRLLSGEASADERVLAEAGVIAVRRSDTALQLLCMVAEGWWHLAAGQAVNARFRGQQALKLMGDAGGLVGEWAHLLERCAYLRNTSAVALREEAASLDLEAADVGFAEAWATALHLSAVRSDAELSYWYSLHRDVMLDKRFRPFARLALSCAADQRTMLARLIPEAERRGLIAPARGADAAPSASAEGRRLGLGQISIQLFGGFRVEKNGYALTDRGWRRKKAAGITARLALCLGTFVPRRTVTEEFWPQLDYAHAREGLYVTLSAMRRALGQRPDGPQYLLTQGDALALNSDFVTCDVVRFDALAREVLLRRQGTSAPRVIEACLEMEQVYRGPLFVPDKGSAVFFTKMRAAYLSKYVDCMIAGCEAAVEEGQISSASWLIQAALRYAPLREDVIRWAMRVLDLQGRRREIVELYNAHLHYLAHELDTLPEKETRELYERIIARQKGNEML